MNDFKDLNGFLTGLNKLYNSRNGEKEKFIKDNWTNIVGDFLYKYTRPDRVVEGTLYIKTVSSTWMSELSFMKEEIINSCNKKLQSDYVKEMKSFVGDGKLEKRTVEQEHKLKNEEKKFYIVQEEISSKDKEIIDKSTEKIEDEELRNVLKKLLANSRIQEKSLLSQGWKKCISCKALHNTGDLVCLICKKSLS